MPQKTILITRAQNQQGETKTLLEQKGARVLELPALVITPPDSWGPLDDALSDLEHFHWIIFSSINGVNSVEQRLNVLGSSLSAMPKTLKIASVGRKTGQALEKHGLKIDFVPPENVADSLISHFPVSGWGLRILIPRVQSGGRTILAEAFGEAGVRVVEVAAYESSCPNDLPAETKSALIKEKVEIIAFTSSKTVRHSADLLKGIFGTQWFEKTKKIKLVSIGPQTTLTCKSIFKRVDAEANPHDLIGLGEACQTFF